MSDHTPNTAPTKPEDQSAAQDKKLCPICEGEGVCRGGMDAQDYPGEGWQCTNCSGTGLVE